MSESPHDERIPRHTLWLSLGGAGFLAACTPVNRGASVVCTAPPTLIPQFFGVAAFCGSFGRAFLRVCACAFFFYVFWYKGCLGSRRGNIFLSVPTYLNARVGFVVSWHVCSIRSSCLWARARISSTERVGRKGGGGGCTAGCSLDIFIAIFVPTADVDGKSAVVLFGRFRDLSFPANERTK